MNLFKDKPKIGFILGHSPELSQREIASVLESQKISYQIVQLEPQVLILETSTALDLPALQKRLGGVIKIAKIVSVVSQPELSSVIYKLVRERAVQLPTNKRFQFGFSLYGAMPKIMGNLGLTIKSQLKKSGVNCRFIISQASDLSSVIVAKEHLIDWGLDVIIVVADSQCFLGYTVAVQDYHDYSKRDYGRPQRDNKSGMLPPKLAKIMINLAKLEPAGVILDPFCGSGTILQEALLLGYRNLIGSDFSAKAIEFSQNNLDWLGTKYQLDISQVKIFLADVAKISEHSKPASVEAIVTEPYLGPSQLIRGSALERVLDELCDLYLRGFKEFAKILKPQGRVVIVFPVINERRLSIIDLIKGYGFSQEKLSESSRGSIVYQREGQRVKREIFVFKKI